MKVREGVNVKDGVSVAGWNNVGVRVGEPVMVGVKVGVNVFVAVSVSVGGVGVRVAVSVSVAVGVTDGVRLPGEGRRAIAINPTQ